MRSSHDQKIPIFGDALQFGEELEGYGKLGEDHDLDVVWEFGDDENPDWVHVSYVSEDENRGRALRAYKEKGKTKYIML